MRVFMGVLLYGLLAAGSAQGADCQLKQFMSLDITGLPDEIHVPVGINDMPKTFALELANSVNFIDEATAIQLGLKIRPIPSPFDKEPPNLITKVAYAPKFQLGAVKVEDMEFLLLPRANASVGVDGYLGSGLLKKLDLELDTAHAKVNLFLPDHCPGKVVYWTQTGFAQLPYKLGPSKYLMIEMELNEQPVTVQLQTSGKSMIGMNAMRRLFKLDANSPGMTLAETRADGTKLYRYPFKTLVAGGLTVSNPNILVRDEQPQDECNGKTRPRDIVTAGHVSEPTTLVVTCYGGSDLLLGLSVLSKLRLYISSQEKLIYLTGAGAQ